MLLASPEEDYAESIGSGFVAPFSTPEQNDALAEMTAEGLVASRKGRAGGLKFKLSANFTRALGGGGGGGGSGGGAVGVAAGGGAVPEEMPAGGARS